MCLYFNCHVHVCVSDNQVCVCLIEKWTKWGENEDLGCTSVT
jgi:hypothetical protein